MCFMGEKNLCILLHRFFSPMRSEIRAGYIRDKDEILETWTQGTRPPHIDLYTHLRDGTMQSPIRMESTRITRLNQLFITESIGFN